MARRSSSLRPWLATLFGIDAGVGGVSFSALRGIQPIDVVLLILSAVTFIGVWPGPGARRVPWMMAAIALPLAGIPVLLATRLWGRSGLMGGALILSILMLFDRAWFGTGSLGIATSVLLLVGDFGTKGPRAPLVATLVATGYVSLFGWFLWMGARLLALS